MKNKKGEQLLSTEVVKTVITVICLMFLVYLLVSLYFARVNSSKLSQAQESIDRINQALNHMELNDLKEYTLDAVSPSKWIILGYVGNEVKPNSCNGKDCLCICKDSKDSEQLEQCSDNGVCSEISILKDFAEFELGMRDGTPIGIKLIRNNGTIEVKLA